MNKQQIDHKYYIVYNANNEENRREAQMLLDDITAGWWISHATGTGDSVHYVLSNPLGAGVDEREALEIMRDNIENGAEGGE